MPLISKLALYYFGCNGGVVWLELSRTLFKDKMQNKESESVKLYASLYTTVSEAFPALRITYMINNLELVFHFLRAWFFVFSMSGSAPTRLFL